MTTTHHRNHLTPRVCLVLEWDAQDGTAAIELGGRVFLIPIDHGHAEDTNVRELFDWTNGHHTAEDLDGCLPADGWPRCVAKLVDLEDGDLVDLFGAVDQYAREAV